LKGLEGMLNTPIYIASLIISILTWLFISIFCDNAKDSKEILTLLKDKTIKESKSPKLNKGQKEHLNKINEILQKDKQLKQ